MWPEWTQWLNVDGEGYIPNKEEPQAKQRIWETS